MAQIKHTTKWEIYGNECLPLVRMAHMEVLQGISIQQVLLEHSLIVQLPVMAVTGLRPVLDACKVFCMTIGQL